METEIRKLIVRDSYEVHTKGNNKRISYIVSLKENKIPATFEYLRSMRGTTVIFEDKLFKVIGFEAFGYDEVKGDSVAFLLAPAEPQRGITIIPTPEQLKELEEKINTNQMNSKKKPHVEPTVESFIGDHAKYDQMGQLIFAVNKQGHHQMLLDLRGWGAIQHLFTYADQTIDERKALKFQDELGEWIVDAINQKLHKPTPKYIISEDDLKKEAKQYSEGWGENNDEKSFIAGFKTALGKLPMVDFKCEYCKLDVREEWKCAGDGGGRTRNHSFGGRLIY